MCEDFLIRVCTVFIIKLFFSTGWPINVIGGWEDSKRINHILHASHVHPLPSGLPYNIEWVLCCTSRTLVGHVLFHFYFSHSFFINYLFLTVFGSLLLLGLFPSCSEGGLLSACGLWPFHWHDFSLCRAQGVLSVWAFVVVALGF